jgi:2-dehydro-3-deoxygalactonokinase
MQSFFSVDWGTSAFRLRLVDAGNKAVLAEIKTDYGMATAFEKWKQLNQPETNRTAFFQSYLFDQVDKITAGVNDSLSNTSIIMLSGMASSSIGMQELPYKELPFCCDGSDLLLHTVTAEHKNVSYKMIIISGVKSNTDVMRGEETILAGCNIVNDSTRQLFILPGTHSKHILVNKGCAQSIATYITGELFDLLSNKSILSSALQKHSIDEIVDGYCFADGVKKGASTNILNSIFQVRTNHLFKSATAYENYQYLSGLLIGYELKDIAKDKLASVTLVSSEGLKNFYLNAFSVAGLSELIMYKNADEALIEGQLKIIQQAGYL